MLGGFLHICTYTCTIYCGLWPPDNTSCIFLTWYQSSRFSSTPHAATPCKIRRLLNSRRLPLRRPALRLEAELLASFTRAKSASTGRLRSEIGVQAIALPIARSGCSPDRGCCCAWRCCTCCRRGLSRRHGSDRIGHDRPQSATIGHLLPRIGKSPGHCLRPPSSVPPRYQPGSAPRIGFCSSGGCSA
jgi:hypothetical protein